MGDIDKRNGKRSRLLLGMALIVLIVLLSIQLNRGGRKEPLVIRGVHSLAPSVGALPTLPPKP